MVGRNSNENSQDQERQLNVGQNNGLVTKQKQEEEQHCFLTKHLASARSNEGRSDFYDGKCCPLKDQDRAEDEKEVKLKSRSAT